MRAPFTGGALVLRDLGNVRWNVPCWKQVSTEGCELSIRSCHRRNKGLHEEQMFQNREESLKQQQFNLP